MSAPVRLVALSTAITEVLRQGPGGVAHISLFNPANATGYLQLYDMAIATGAVQGVAPFYTLGCESSGHCSEDFSRPMGFANGLYASAATLPTGSTALSAGLQVTITIG